MISDIYEEFMLEQRYRNNTEKTIDWYSSNLKSFFGWLNSDDVANLSLENFKQYGVYLHDTVTKHNGDKLSDSSIQGNLRAVKAFFNFAIDQQYIEDFSRKLKLPKSISFVNEKKQPLTKTHVMEVMQEQFGYSKAEANLAANKLCDELNLEHSQFLAHNEQLEIINSFNTNIKFQNDSILLKDTTFTSVNFKGGSGTHIFITNGDKKAALSPATMSETEMMKICTTTLGMNEEQAAEAVSKAKKIDEQINAKLHQTTIYRNDGVQQVEIERKSKNSFSVRVGNTEKEYDFADPNLAAKLSKDFGITEGKANNIIDHAQKQSALMNRVEKAFNKTAKSVKEKTEKTVKDVSKGVKR